MVACTMQEGPHVICLPASQATTGFSVFHFQFLDLTQHHQALKLTPDACFSESPQSTKTQTNYFVVFY